MKAREIMVCASSGPEGPAKTAWGGIRAALLANSEGTLWPRDSSLQVFQESDAMATALSVLLFASFVMFSS
jgi:hypothetical protein